MYPGGSRLGGRVWHVGIFGRTRISRGMKGQLRVKKRDSNHKQYTVETETPPVTPFVGARTNEGQGLYKQRRLHLYVYIYLHIYDET